MIMRVSQLFGLMALPVVFALPAATQHSSNEVDTTLNHRSMLTEASQFHFAPFQLTNVGLECSRLAAEEMYACELRFDWHDPNSVKQNNITGCSCIHKWSWDGETASVGENNTYGEAYSLCYKDLPVYFEMRISAFNSTNDFAVEIAHCYHDSENFSAPWDYPIIFAERDIRLPVISQTVDKVRLYDAGPILANITAIAD